MSKVNSTLLHLQDIIGSHIMHTSSHTQLCVCMCEWSYVEEERNGFNCSGVCNAVLWSSGHKIIEVQKS